MMEEAQPPISDAQAQNLANSIDSDATAGSSEEGEGPNDNTRNHNKRKRAEERETVDALQEGFLNSAVEGIGLLQQIQEGAQAVKRRDGRQGFDSNQPASGTPGSLRRSKRRRPDQDLLQTPTEPEPQQDALLGLEGLEEQKYTPFQMKAWVLTGHPLNLPGYQWPGPMPQVQMGARWQLDLRTGERLEDASGAHLNLSQFAALQGQHSNAYTMQNALAAQALSTKNAVFNNMGQEGYNLSAAMYQGPLALSHLPQNLNGQANASGPWTAQMLAAQGLIAQHNQSSLAAIQNLPSLQHLTNNPRSSGRQRSTVHSQDLDSLPDIPLRRRGRPTGETTGTTSNPQELVQRRMQANRAAASRSHFRRKREMELLEKDCAVAEARIQELRMALAAMIQQEEQLRMHQQTIRAQLSAGIKPDESLSLPSLLQQQMIMHEPLEVQDLQQQVLEHSAH